LRIFDLMKSLATIFFIYFSALMAQPMATLIHNGLTKEKVICTMKCCQHHKQPEKKQAQNLPFGCCNNDMSNPFAQCCCCCGFIPEKQNIGVTILPDEIILVFTKKGILIPNYNSDCWHPPELAG
jgi:hypothetical protein